MHILVTGGAGFIGANLTRFLLARGCRVRVLDKLLLGADALAGLDLELIEGDVTDGETVARALAGCEGVVHLAAQTGVEQSLADPVRDCRINVLGTLTVLEACRAVAASGGPSGDRSPPRVVFASSNAPMGRQPPPVDETSAPLPLSPYGASKLAGEGYCLAYHGAFGLGTVALRFGNAYGPWSAHKQSVVARFIRDLRETGSITIDGDGSQTRDFIHTDDLCAAVHRALTASVAGEIFQIASGRETSIQELAKTLEAVSGRPVKAAHGPGRTGDMARNFSRIDKARRLLGWVPQVALRDGLAHLWRWYEAGAGRC